MSTANYKELEHDLPFYVLETSELEDWELSDIYDQVSSWLDQVNLQELTLFELSCESGYYTGMQLYAKIRSPHFSGTYSREELQELDDDDAYWLFECNTASELMELYEKERQYIAQLFELVASDYGFIHIRCIGRFSNGEAIYEEAS